MMAEFREPPEAESVVKGVGGVCPYCHLRTKGTWKIKVEIGPLWPHRVTCPQCHQAWDSIAHFNQDAKRIVVQALRDNPDRIEEMNRNPDQHDWDSFMDDNIARHKDVQDFETKKRLGRPWSPYDGLLSDFEKRIWTQMGGLGGEAGEADDQDSNGDGGGVGECDTPNGGELQRDAEEGDAAAGQDSNDDSL